MYGKFTYICSANANYDHLDVITIAQLKELENISKTGKN